MPSNLANMIWLSTTRFLTRASQFITLIVLARVLPLELFGAYSLFTAAVLLSGQLGNLGLKQASTYLIASDQHNDGHIVWWQIAFLPVLTAISIIAVLWLNSNTIETLSGNVALVTTVAVMAVVAISLMQGVLLGRNDVRKFSLSESGPRVLFTLFVTLLWLLGALTIETALWAFALSSLVFVPLLARDIFRTMRSFTYYPAAFPSIVKYSLLFSISTFAISLNSRVGLLFSGSYLGESEAGLFFAGMRLNELLLEVATVASVVIFADASRHKGSKEGIAAAASLSAWVFWLFNVVGFFAYLYAPTLVWLLLGDDYAASADICRVLALGLSAAAVTRVLNSVLNGLGKPYVGGAVAWAGLILNAGLSLLLLPSQGLLAPAIGSTVGQVATAITYVMIFKLSLGVPIGALLVPRKIPVSGKIKKLLGRIGR